MNKLYSLAAAVLVSLGATAQVNVTYKVDITDYLAAGNTLGANGIRVGGNFATNGGTNGANAMADWSPSDANSALVQEGSTNVWAITVTYPAGSINATQQYKFVNNDWGTNEGTDPANTIATDGCGVDDGSGNINRTLVIPDGDVTLSFCWDRCAPCGTAGFQLINAVNTFNVFPNPSNEVTNVQFSVTSPSVVTFEVYNALGQRVKFDNFGSVLPGSYQHTINMSSFEGGIYFVKMNMDGKTRTTRVNLVK